MSDQQPCSCRLMDSWMSAPGRLTLQIEVDCTDGQESDTITPEIAPEVATAPETTAPTPEEVTPAE